MNAFYIIGAFVIGFVAIEIAFALYRKGINTGFDQGREAGEKIGFAAAKKLYTAKVVKDLLVEGGSVVKKVAKKTTKKQ